MADPRASARLEPTQGDSGYGVRDTATGNQLADGFASPEAAWQAVAGFDWEAALASFDAAPPGVA